MMEQSIGGYFGLELKVNQGFLHPNSLYLNSARNCLEYILRVRKYTRVYIPFYTCQVILEPFLKMGIDYTFYHINRLLEPTTFPILNNNEAFLYTNYYGLKQECIEHLARHYSSQLIVDNSQALFAQPIQGIDTFYSPRKFIGVADGGCLYCENESIYNSLRQDQSWDRMSHLLKRLDVLPEFGFNDFHKNDDALINQPMMRMSNLTEKILSSCDYECIANSRRNNYEFLSSILNSSNKINLTRAQDSVPMVYPYWTNDTSMRQRLIDNKIYVARYWPNVLDWCQEGDLEYEFAKNLIPLPVDQRYGEEEMKKIIEIVCQK